MKKKTEITPELNESQLPALLVQLPIYNEANSVEALLHHLVSQNYPKDLLKIQILDDSDDETSEILDRLVKTIEPDIAIEIVRRDSREGYKAGALQLGMENEPNYEFLAIFDADFRPRSDFLRKGVSLLLTRKNLGLLQGRWEHRNSRVSPTVMNCIHCGDEA